MRISDWSSDVCSSDLLFGNPERLGLFRDLLVDQWRAHEARADHIGAHALLAAFLGDHAGEAEQAVLGGDIQRLQTRGALGMRRADRKSVVEGKGVSVRVTHGGRRRIKKKKKGN